jgi:AraC-like DNA-binding protein
VKIVASGLVSSQGFGEHDHQEGAEGEFHYFLAGRGRFYNDGKEYEQNPGSLFYSKPVQRHRSHGSGELPTVFFFVRFQNGSDDREWNELVDKLFASSDVVNIGNGFQLVFEEIRQRASSSNTFFQRSAEHRLYGLLYDLAGGRTPLPTVGQTYVNEALELMQSSLHGTLDLSILARRLGIDSSYFCRIFRQAVGMSPIRYYRSLKVEAARYLLLQTQLPVGQIAANLAFRDEYHFSHSIKQSTGLSPTQIRRGIAETGTPPIPVPNFSIKSTHEDIS